MLIDADNEWECIEKLDWEFPEGSHDYFKDYPALPSEKVVQLAEMKTDHIEQPWRKRYHWFVKSNQAGSVTTKKRRLLAALLEFSILRKI